MLDLKSCPNAFKRCLNNIQISFYIINWSFSKNSKSQQAFWGTIERSEFVSKNFQKSPNLVTMAEVGLIGKELGR